MTSAYKDSINMNDLLRIEFDLRLNSAIWFVSNCKSEERMRLATNLGQFYPVTILGGCSRDIRERYPLPNMSHLKIEQSNCATGTQCERDVFKSAKFYLSLENTNCTDYITEKFWKSLANHLIPIVMQPSREDYERIAPAHSFIHMADFGYDMQKLAKFLDNVSSNFELYKLFFEWKHNFKAIYDSETLEKFRMCELCSKLNNQHLYNNSYYKKISDFIESACTRT